MVCEVCQKSLASFSTLVSSWLIANDWNEDDPKDDFEKVDVKKEALNDEISDSDTNSPCALEVNTTNSATNGSATKKVKGKRGQSTSVAGSEPSKKIKIEIDEISDSSNSVPLNNKDVKREETEDNVETEEVEELQLKNEEIDIKDEDE